MNIEAEILDIKQRLEALEGVRRAAQGGPKGPSSGEHPPQMPIWTKLPLATRRAMEKHAPAMSRIEIESILSQIPAGRRFKKAVLARNLYAEDPQRMDKAARVLFWLKRGCYLHFDESKFEYFRAAPGSVNDSSG